VSAVLSHEDLVLRMLLAQPDTDVDAYSQVPDMQAERMKLERLEGEVRASAGAAAAVSGHSSFASPLENNPLTPHLVEHLGPWASPCVTPLVAAVLLCGAPSTDPLFRTYAFHRVRMLLLAGADPNLRAPCGMRFAPLMLAVRAGREDVARLLLECGADPEAPRLGERATRGSWAPGPLPAADAATAPSGPPTHGRARAAKAKPAPLPTPSDDAAIHALDTLLENDEAAGLAVPNALFTAVSLRDATLVRLLLTAGAQVDARGPGGTTPLRFLATLSTGGRQPVPPRPLPRRERRSPGRSRSPSPPSHAGDASGAPTHATATATATATAPTPGPTEDWRLLDIAHLLLRAGADPEVRAWSSWKVHRDAGTGKGAGAGAGPGRGAGPAAPSPPPSAPPSPLAPILHMRDDDATAPGGEGDELAVYRLCDEGRALDVAACRGHRGLVSLLVEFGADPAPLPFEWTPSLALYSSADADASERDYALRRAVRKAVTTDAPPGLNRGVADSLLPGPKRAQAGAPGAAAAAAAAAASSISLLPLAASPPPHVHASLARGDPGLDGGAGSAGLVRVTELGGLSKRHARFRDGEERILITYMGEATARGEAEAVVRAVVGVG
jgi:hypothetical protein